MPRLLSSFFKCLLSPIRSCIGGGHRHRQSNPANIHQVVLPPTTQRVSNSPPASFIKPSHDALSPQRVAYLSRTPRNASGSSSPTLFSKPLYHTSVTDLGTPTNPTDKLSRFHDSLGLEKPPLSLRNVNLEGSWPLDHEAASSSGGQPSMYARDWEGTQVGWLTPPFGTPSPLPAPYPKLPVPQQLPPPFLPGGLRLKASRPQLKLDTSVPMFSDHLVESPKEMDPSEYPYNEDLDEKAAKAAAAAGNTTRGVVHDAFWGPPAEAEIPDFSLDGIMSMPEPMIRKHPNAPINNLPAWAR